MEWSFDGSNGAVTVRREGSKAVCQAIRTAESKGLYKAWLQGGEGRALLGTLIPEGGALRLRRVLEISELERLRVWPPVGAEITLAYSFLPEEPPPPDWCWTDSPCRLLEPSGLSHCLRGVKRTLLKRNMEGFLLAFPWSCHEPFPIPALFCLAGIERLSNKRYILFRFSHQGIPELLCKFSAAGDAS